MPHRRKRHHDRENRNDAPEKDAGHRGALDCTTAPRNTQPQEKDRAGRVTSAQNGDAMTRGKHPFQGRSLARPLAGRRGSVSMIEPEQDTLLDLVITSPGSFAAVTLKKVEMLHGPAEVFETRYDDLIGQIRQLPDGCPVSREVWYYNRYGSWRFFRIEDTGLRELTRDGMVVLTGGS